METIKLNEDTLIYWSGFNGYSVGKISEDSLKPKSLQINGCERIILKDKSLEFSFEITKGKIEDFDEIVINGVKFVKENTNGMD